MATPEKRHMKPRNDQRLSALLFAVLLLPGLVLAAASVNIEVGDRVIEVPLPDGFVELTPEMSPYYETSRAYIAESNLRFLTLIPEETAEFLLRGESVELNRYINIESEKAISATSVSAGLFAQLRDIVRGQISDVYANAEERISELVEDGNKKISEDFDADMAVELGGVVPLPVHLETDNAMAHSMYMTVSGSVDGQDAGSEVMAATTLFMHVKDKVLFLYVYGTEAELEWTREAAAALGESVLAANPLSAEEASTVEATASVGMDWGQVFDKALIGALIGGIIGLASYFFRKRKKDELGPPD